MGVGSDEVTIRPMRRDELREFIRATERDYAEQKHTMGGVEQAQAEREAAEETAQYFPNGALLPGHEVFVAEDASGSLGRLWVAPRQGDPGSAFVYDVDVTESARGRGIGRALMRHAEAWAREAGYPRLQLHVFGGNEVAIGLYRSLGYTVTDLHMSLDLNA